MRSELEMGGRLSVCARELELARTGTRPKESIEVQVRVSTQLIYYSVYALNQMFTLHIYSH